MIRGGEINKGTVLIIKNAPYLVVEREFVNPGKGTAFARCKLKNLKDGSVLSQQVFKTPDTFEDATVDTINAQYIYSESDAHIFQNAETFDQISVPADLNPDLKYYLRDDIDYQIVIWNGNPIDVKIPQKMIFTVAESENYTNTNFMYIDKIAKVDSEVVESNKGSIVNMSISTKFDENTDISGRQ